uniref:Aminotransferase-like plant mobile domain-containing protein n=1 Tax=Triticum urartu TaxID=4572 RepID=A0A8R7UUI4_TRIUA
MGFQTFLQITSMSNIDSIYLWLSNHFNTTSCSIEMGNGFKFPITTSTIHKIFGMPIGGVPVITKPSEATYEFIKHELGTTSPTIEYLFSIINDELPEDKYCRIFILILLSLFVAPNSSGVVTKFVYNAVVDIDSISQYDWCLLCLSYMVYSIKKAKLNKASTKKFIPGGCKLLMVISYFEFLIISELKFPSIEPRLPLCSANMLNSYMALDALHGERNEYGRLPIKHISSTPFNVSVFIELPKEIPQYIESKFTDISMTQ